MERTPSPFDLYYLHQDGRLLFIPAIYYNIPPIYPERVKGTLEWCSTVAYSLE